MELIFVDIINSKKVPKILKYILITLVAGFLEFIFIGIMIKGIFKFAKPFGVIMSVLLFICYIYLIIKIKKYGYVNKDE